MALMKLVKRDHLTGSRNQVERQLQIVLQADATIRDQVRIT